MTGIPLKIYPQMGWRLGRNRMSQEALIGNLCGNGGAMSPTCSAQASADFEARDKIRPRKELPPEGGLMG
ncbi:MAG: hypothetical protein C7B43_07345 [Sulfobacillus benefaciens]|uniref:Uncharacterized protein n=1 Tax=Sulfobacillus benefaciens TaxID=453960 RepID=A0A2T2X6J1_9FIRM|nr:MAG: hypothetical protein C7B43_07345 [Sulfobacillus benefaciens]HBQ94855.1 hypothetical protein [Sulfobacillus sp.]